MLVVLMKNVKQYLIGLQKHAMMGISYMGPTFTMAGLVMVSSELLLNQGFIDAGTYTKQLAAILFSLILPVFSMFTAYSIADKPGLIPGLAAGWLASNSIGKSPDTGFFGTLVLAFIVGYSVKYIAEKISFKDLYNSIIPTFVIPLLVVVLILPIHLLLIVPIFGTLNHFIIYIVFRSGIGGQIIYAIIIAAAISMDLGGPINKAAILFGTPLSSEFILPMTAINLAIVIPPIGIGLSTMIDKIFKKQGVYDEDMREIGRDSFKLGFIAISEGGLPFLYQKPRGTMIVNVIGSVVGSMVAVSLGAVQWYPIPAIWGWLLVKNIPAYILGIGVGVIVTAIGNVIIRLKD